MERCSQYFKRLNRWNACQWGCANLTDTSRLEGDGWWPWLAETPAENVEHQAAEDAVTAPISYVGKREWWQWHGDAQQSAKTMQ